MARSFVVVAFLVFVLFFSSVLARKEPGVEPSTARPKAPFVGSKAPIKARLDGPKAPPKAKLIGPKAPLKAPLAGPKTPLKKTLVGSKAPPARPFTVVGKIYCDPCQFEFMSRLSTPLEGVKVNLECRKADNNKATYVKEGKTDANGVYKILVDGDHEDEICEVKPKPTRKGKCTDPMTNKSDRIVLTNNMGSSSLIRLVNPLGFKTKAVDGQCRKVVKELGLDKLEA